MFGLMIGAEGTITQFYDKCRQKLDFDTINRYILGPIIVLTKKDSH